MEAGRSLVEKPAPTRSGRRGMLLRIAGSAAMLGMLFWVLPLDRLWAAMQRVPPSRLGLVLLLYLGVHTVAAAKWRLMVNLAGAGLNFAQSAQCYFSGLFGNVFLPSIVGGDVIRAGLALRWGKNRAGTLFGSLLDRMLDVAGLGLVALLGAMLLPGTLSEPSRRVFWALAAAFVLGGAGGAAALWLTPVRRFPFKIRRKLAKLRHAIRSMARRPARVGLALLLGMAIQVSFVLLTVALAEACGLHVPLRAWLFAWPLAKISALLPVTQGGIGVREAALAALLLPFGAPAVLTVAAGLVWEVILISGGLISGGASLLLERVNGGNSVVPTAAAPVVSAE